MSWLIACAWGAHSTCLFRFFYLQISFLPVCTFLLFTLVQFFCIQSRCLDAAFTLDVPGLSSGILQASVASAG